MSIFIFLLLDKQQHTQKLLIDLNLKSNINGFLMKWNYVAQYFEADNFRPCTLHDQIDVITTVNTPFGIINYGLITDSVGIAIFCFVFLLIDAIMSDSFENCSNHCEQRELCKQQGARTKIFKMIMFARTFIH